VQTTVATLLLITSAVILTCVVIDYAVGIVQQTLNTDNIPQLARIRDIENRIQNQTDSLFNQAPPELPTQQSP
jgi:hypothetical protein